MGKTYLVSDVHGNYDGLIRALRRHRLIDRHGHRQLARRHTIASIGDLGNCVEKSHDGDLACFDLVGKIIDTVCVGNHEWPYIDAHNPRSTFRGFHAHTRVGEKIRELYESGFLVPCLMVGETLVSHAGLSHQIARGMPVEDEHANILEHWLARDWNFSYFSATGHVRGGKNRCGGIFWCDFDKEFVPVSFPQIVGHTPGEVRVKGNSLCIDVGAADHGTEPFVLEVSP